MKPEILMALIGVGGTALGAFVGAWFAYLSQKNQHIQLVKRMRVERTFEAAEQLLQLLIQMQSTGYLKFGGKQFSVALMFKNPSRFKEWYYDFQGAWYTKQYLLNQTSLVACRAVHEFIVSTIEKYPNILNPDVKPVFSQEEFAKLHSDFLSTVSVAVEALKEYLLHELEET